MPDPGAWLDGGSDYVENNYRLVARFVVAQVLLSALLVVLFDWRPVRSGLRWAFAHVPVIGDYVPAEVEEGRIVKRTAWFTSFRQRAETETVYVCVRLDTGTEYYGYVMEYTPGDEPLADRELVLMAPLAVRHPGGTEREALPADWKRMVLHGDGISTILVSYV